MSPTVDQPFALNESRVFSASLWYSKPGRFGGGSNHTVPTSPGGQLVAVVVEDADAGEHRLADRAGVREPVGAVDERRAHALGRGVVLVDDRAPPLDHLALHLDRARRGRVDRDLLRRQVVAGAHLVGQLQHAHEHRRHPLAVRDAVAARCTRAPAPGRTAPSRSRCRRAASCSCSRRAARSGTAARARGTRRSRPCATPWSSSPSRAAGRRRPGGGSCSGRPSAGRSCPTSRASGCLRAPPRAAPPGKLSRVSS